MLDPRVDLYRHVLVRASQLQAQHVELRQLTHLVESDVGVGAVRPLLLGLGVLREEGLREHEDLAVQVRAVVEAHGDAAPVVTRWHRLHAVPRLVVTEVVDPDAGPHALELHRDDGDRLDLGEPTRSRAREQLRGRLA